MNMSELYRSKRNTIRLYESEVDGELCYSLEHTTEPIDKCLFSHDDEIIGEVMKKIEDCGIGYRNGFKFGHSKETGMSGCSVPIFLCSLYEGIDPDSMRHAKIELTRKNGKADLRRDQIR